MLKLRQTRNSSKGQQTRSTILDVAEEQFGAHGFDGVPTRLIAKLAGISPGVLSYHYPTKELLFEAVVVRRAEELKALRRSAIDDLPRLTLEGLLEAFFSPFMSKIESAGQGWRSYARLLGQVAQEARWNGLVKRLFADAARDFVALMRQAVPGLGEEAALYGYYHLVSVMVGFFTASGNLDSVSGDRLKSDDLRGSYPTAIAFLAGGIRALAEPGVAPSHGARAGEQQQDASAP